MSIRTNPTNVKIGVIVVNWNSFDVLSRCLFSLRSQKYPPTCTVVVDNNSNDAPVELAGKAPENTQYFRLSSNSGFAYANNLATSYLKDCDWIALINPDAFPEPDWLECLIDASRRHPEFSCFSSMTIMASQPRYLDGTGDVYHISGIAWRRGYGRDIASTKITEEEVFAPCAAAAMYRRDAWEEAGGFDEDFFCYFEDIDLAFRMRLMEHRCLFVPTAVAYHVGSVTSGGKQSDFSVYYGHRNMVWTYVKNMPGYAFWLYLPLHIAMNVLTIGWFVARGRWRVILHAKWDALKGIKQAWQKRRVIQAKRKASVAQVLRLMDKRIIPIRHLGKTLYGRTRSLRATEAIQPCSASLGNAAGVQADYFKYLRSRGLFGLVYRKLLLYPRLAQHLSGRVLDVGCGIGDFLEYRPETVGVDINPHAVDWCRQRGLHVRLMDEDRLPFEDDSFDGVVLDNVLEHLTEPRVLLSEILRVLAPAGRLLVGVPGRRGYACDPDHKVFYDEASLEYLMAAAGFLRKTTFHMPFKNRWLEDRLPQYCLYGVYERS